MQIQITPVWLLIVNRFWGDSHVRGDVLCWFSKTQKKCVTLFMTEAEYVALV